MADVQSISIVILVRNDADGIELMLKLARMYRLFCENHGLEIDWTWAKRWSGPSGECTMQCDIEGPNARDLLREEGVHRWVHLNEHIGKRCTTFAQVYTYDSEIVVENEQIDQCIRSYVEHPYSLVKDLRSGFENENVEEVFAGNLPIRFL